MRSHNICFKWRYRKTIIWIANLSAAVTLHNIICGVYFFSSFHHYYYFYYYYFCSLLIFQRNKNRNQTNFRFAQITFIPFGREGSVLLLLLLFCSLLIF